MHLIAYEVRGKATRELSSDYESETQYSAVIKTKEPWRYLSVGITIVF